MGPTTVAFAIGAVGVVAGTLLGWVLLGAQLGSEGAKVGRAVIFMAEQTRTEHMASDCLWHL